MSDVCEEDTDPFSVLDLTDVSFIIVTKIFK